MKTINLAVILLLATALWAGETKAPEPPKKVPAEQALKIRDVQVQLLSLNQQKQQLEQKEQQLSQQIQALIKQAYKDADLKEEEYSIDDRTWTFTRNPEPTSAKNPTPPPKK